MSRMSELDATLAALSESLHAAQEAARSLRAQLGTPVPDDAAETPPPPKAYTLEEVRAVLLAKRKAGFVQETRALLTARGVDRLSEVDPADYAALLREAEVIGV